MSEPGGRPREIDDAPTPSDRRRAHGAPNSPDRSALFFGVVLSAVLAGTLVIAGLKAGITPGVSPLVVLLAWGLFRRWGVDPQGARAFNIAQVAGSAGMAVTAGVIFTAPLLPILARNLGHEASLPPLGSLMAMSVAGALIGFGVVGSGARRFLTDPTYPAPEARAAATLIETASDRLGRRPALGSSLVPALVAGVVAPLLVRVGLAREQLTLIARELETRSFRLDVPFAPIYLGIGALLTLSTALLVFLGSGIRLIGDYVLAALPFGITADVYPADSMRWVGGAAMSVAVAWSLVRYFLDGRHRGRQKIAMPAGTAWSGATRGPTRSLPADLPPVIMTSGDNLLTYGALLVGFAILIVWLFAQLGAQPVAFALAGAVLVTATLMTILGAVLSLQIGSSASPVSGTVFVTVLVLATVVLAFQVSATMVTAEILTCVVVAACVAVASANDASQDYRTMQLCGVPVREGFVGQLLGLLVGALVVPLVIVIAHQAYGLGTDALPAPQGQMFATLVQGLLFSHEIPSVPILVGLSIGVGAVALEAFAARRGASCPSMALTVGIYLPPYLGVGVLLGALARAVTERGAGQSHASILVAAGLITGSAAFDLIVGVAILGGLDADGMSMAGALPEALPIVVGILGVGALIALIAQASRRGG